MFAEQGSGIRGQLLEAAAPSRAKEPAREAQPFGQERARARVDRAAPQPEVPDSTPPSSGLARTVVGWVFALAALAALAYLANTVFTRPDPRKSRRARDPGAEQAP
jgi:hypothetical protein